MLNEWVESEEDVFITVESLSQLRSIRRHL